MKLLWGAALVATSLTLVGGSTSVKHLCNGIMPENDMRIPVTRIQSGGISEAQFHGIMDKIVAYYAPVVQAKGGTLTLNRLWTDDTVNASAERRGRSWIINMYGGLARYPTITEDGMLMVACHEAGHHLGGAPKVASFWGMMDWASNEGQSDYFASLRCMRVILAGADNAAWMASRTVDVVVKTTCESAFTDVNSQIICMRSALAGENLAVTFQNLKKETTVPRFDTPDQKTVSSTDDSHPAPQCRLDTYYQGALCVHDTNVELSDTDARMGTCIDMTKIGARSRCWYSPKASVPSLELALQN